MRSLAVFGPGNWLQGTAALLLIAAACAVYLRLLYSLSLTQSLAFAAAALLVALPLAYAVILPAIDRALGSLPSLSSSGELANSFILATLAATLHLAPRTRSWAAWLQAIVALAAAVAACLAVEIVLDWSTKKGANWLGQSDLRSLLYAVLAWCLVGWIMQYVAVKFRPNS